MHPKLEGVDHSARVPGQAAIFQLMLYINNASYMQTDDHAALFRMRGYFEGFSFNSIEK